KHRVDPSAETHHPGEDSLAVDGAHCPAQRADEPEQEDDAEADQYPAEVDAVSVAAVGVPLDDLCRRRIAGRRTTEEQDRPDEEQARRRQVLRELTTVQRSSVGRQGMKPPLNQPWNDRY